MKKIEFDPFTEIILKALKTKPGTVTHVDVTHTKTCGTRDGDACDCQPTYAERWVM